MRELVIGDVHGCRRALDALLAVVSPTRDERIVTLGDYVDRGPDSPGVLDRLIELSQRHEVIPLRGNHDELMLYAREDDDAYDRWLAYGGDDVLEAYGLPVKQSSLRRVPGEHWRFLAETCRDLHESEEHFFVHGGVDPQTPLRKQRPRVCRWKKLHDARPHASGKTMICGHTAQKNGLPRHIGFAICIDTWAYGGGWLTCLDVQAGEYWQANQRGQTRSGHIDDCREKSLQSA